MSGAAELHLREVQDQHFAWLLGERDAVDDLVEPPGGVDDKAVLKIVRKLAADLHATGCRAHWLIVNGNEIVGLCGFIHSPTDTGEAEIGYGVAPSRRGQGIATRAVGLIVQKVRASGAVSTLIAQTAVSNPTSQIVLERNGFIEASRGYNAEDGDVICWTKQLGKEAIAGSVH